MSRSPSLPPANCQSFPRVSGDEPVTRLDGSPEHLFSPRERG